MTLAHLLARLFLSLFPTFKFTTSQSWPGSDSQLGESSTRKWQKIKSKKKIKKKVNKNQVKANPCTCLILFLRMLRFISASGPVDHITEALGSLTTSGDDSKEKEKIPSSAPGSSNRRKNDPLTGSAVQRQPIDRREELCQRHVQQLFIRGEQVALVSVLPL